LAGKPDSGEVFPRVEIVFNHNGADGAMVRALCAPPAPCDAPVQGIVLAGTGNGTVHRGLEAALRQAQSQGVTVVRTTRCARGRVLPRSDGRGQEFPIVELSPVKARIELMLQLAAHARAR
jgi:L-asparaginase